MKGKWGKGRRREWEQNENEKGKGKTRQEKGRREGKNRRRVIGRQGWALMG